MISPYQLLRESGFAQYTAMARFTYDRENSSLGAEKLAEMVRAIPGSTRVTTVSLDKDNGIAIFQVKLISAKTPKAAFVAFKENALKKFKGMLLKVEIGAGTIEKKGDFILKEEKREVRPQTNLGRYLGQLLEEGLLLEVSIEELRRQFVECDPPKLTAEVFDQIVQACSNKSNYATWMCKKVADNLINTEDLHLWSEVFEFFDRYKQRFQKKDINQVKTSEDINAFLTDYNTVKDAVEAKKATGQTQKVKDETDQCLLGHLRSSDGQDWLVYKTNPGQWALERKIGSGTSWCTVAQQSYFDMYMRDYHDPAYYIFINKKNPKEKYQIHYGSNQCKDKLDHEVDYSREFVQDFYRYLEKVDNRTDWPRNAIRGKELLEQRKQIAKELEEYPNQLERLTSRDLAEGKIYSFSFTNDFVRSAAVFRDLGMSSLDAIGFVEARRGFVGNGTACIIIQPKDGDWDIVTAYQSYSTNQLVSIKSSENRYGGWDLDLANSDNIELYKVAAQGLHTEIRPVVLVRCDKNLPDLKSFKFKSEGNRSAYKIPDGRRNRSVLKAYMQCGLSERYLEQPIGEEIYVFKGPEVTTNAEYAVFNAHGECFSGMMASGDLDKINNRLAIYKFVGLDLNDLSRDPKAKVWNSSGGTKAIENSIKDSEEEVEGLMEGFKIGKSAKIAELLGQPEGETIPFVHKENDFNLVVISYGSSLRIWDVNRPFDNSYLLNLGDYRNTIKTIPAEVLIKFCQYIPMEIPLNLEKIYGRARGIVVPNVTRVLRQQADHFQVYDLPYVKNIYGNRVYTINENGLYGTWEQLGPAIRESTPTHYPRLLQMIAAHQGCTVDVLLYYNRGISSRPWNGLIRVIDQDRKVVAYARRYGGSYNLDWSYQDNVAPDRQADAGQAEANYVAPEPPAPRAPRGQRAAAAPAAPAPEVPQEQQQQLQQYRRNIQAAQNVYLLPTSQTELIRALGFTNLAANVQNAQGDVVIYDVAPHRGGDVSRAALVNIENQNVAILSLPGNQVLGNAQAASNQWRSITRILDNSTRTFQQCVGVCNQTHTPLPVGLQGWLAYRGVGQ